MKGTSWIWDHSSAGGGNGYQGAITNNYIGGSTIGGRMGNGKVIGIRCHVRGSTRVHVAFASGWRHERHCAEGVGEGGLILVPGTLCGRPGLVLLSGLHGHPGRQVLSKLHWCMHGHCVAVCTRDVHRKAKSTRSNQWQDKSTRMCYVKSLVCSRLRSGCRWTLAGQWTGRGVQTHLNCARPRIEEGRRGTMSRRAATGAIVVVGAIVSVVISTAIAVVGMIAAGHRRGGALVRGAWANGHAGNMGARTGGCHSSDQHGGR